VVCPELALGDECGADQDVEVRDVGSADGEDRDAVLVLGVGSRVEVVGDEFCSQCLGIFAVVDTSVCGVGGNRWVDLAGT
jgi:hypothetical protein